MENQTEIVKKPIYKRKWFLITVEKYIKDNMNDPDSYEHVKTTYLETPNYLVVTTKYRGKNKFGGLVLQESMFKVNYEGQVLEVLQ